ncbi:MAG: GAF domain-containing protein [Sulfuritalea sp.]|nr:GAF domain-containing protein [Sulfuritalea sp.]
MPEVISKPRGNSWLWPVLVLIIGIGLSTVLGNVLQREATASWQRVAEQETTQLSKNLLGWVEESYSMLSGLVALVENSGQVDAGEFLNAVDGMEARAKVNFMRAKSLLERSDEGWRVKYSSAIEGADPIYPTEGARPPALLEQALNIAQNTPNEWIMSAPFAGGDGKKHVYLALATTGNPNVALAGVLNIGEMVEGLFNTNNIAGLYLSMTLKAEGSDMAAAVISTAPDILVAFRTNTLLYTARANLDLGWQVTNEFAGGSSSILARGMWIGGALVSILAAIFVSILLKQNYQVHERVEMATRDLEQAMAAKNEVAEISLAVQQARTPGECGEILLSRFADRIASRQGMLAVVAGDESLDVVARYGAPPEGSAPSRYAMGEGLVGRCAVDRKPIKLSLPDDEIWRIRSGMGSSAPAEVWLFPVQDGNVLVGVIELGLLAPLDDAGRSLLDEIMPVIALRLGDLVRRLDAGRDADDPKPKAV